ncbi:MAG TPA: glycosyltransferase family 2 protein [Candidatus Hydrogenedentes bacterium]|mgnify:CR=1 FL=1|nr:glycosyltransferase family 2 protein [Candidatus Hydrogenedentota bacterium]HOS01742.1 glycosyltransferase family 2 protein [Candidatus Hydrogenedentota bacterium]
MSVTPGARKLISVLTPCYNEEENVREVYERVRQVFETQLTNYDYEHLFIDNASRDRTVPILKELAHADKRLKIIVNARNFGQVRSPFHALMQTQGDAVIGIVADLQDPPEMIVDFVRKWEEGYKVVIGVKATSEETPLFFAVRKMYYNLIRKLSDVEQIKNATGFGLYDRAFVDVLRKLDDPYPYFRGLICDIGFERAEIKYDQPARKRGFTKNNFYTLYDLAMLGIVNYSKIPLRLATMTGFSLGAFSLLVAVIYFGYKLVFWKNFQVGAAPVVIGLFFFSAVQLFFIGILGEYIGAIYTQVLKRPLVVEKERINFD